MRRAWLNDYKPEAQVLQLRLSVLFRYTKDQ